jgi:hypothetical protein
LLLGIWKNVEDLENSISLDELEVILKASHDREHRQNKFAAALKGINLDEADKESIKERFDEVKRRAEAKTTGKSEDSILFDELGLDIETE